MTRAKIRTPSNHPGLTGHIGLAGLALALAACHAAQPAAPATSATAAPHVYPTVGSVERLDPALDALIAPDSKIEKLAEGFVWA
jgi:gluconolactonase